MTLKKLGPQYTGLIFYFTDIDGSASAGTELFHARVQPR